jgi:hypothetical protein
MFAFAVHRFRKASSRDIRSPANRHDPADRLVACESDEEALVSLMHRSDDEEPMAPLE